MAKETKGGGPHVIATSFVFVTGNNVTSSFV
jgi:hypothetical protein